MRIFTFRFVPIKLVRLTFYEVGSVTGNGTTTLHCSYSLTDDVVSAPEFIIYYRLKQIDADGKSVYSSVITIKLKNLNEQINMWPNPFTNNLNVNVEWSRNENINIRVISINGEKVISKNIPVNKGLNHFTIQDLFSLSSGTYYIQFISASSIVTRKIIK